VVVRARWARGRALVVVGARRVERLDAAVHLVEVLPVATGLWCGSTGGRGAQPGRGAKLNIHISSRIRVGEAQRCLLPFLKIFVPEIVAIGPTKALAFKPPTSPE
jgi:hypothetical protein